MAAFIFAPQEQIMRKLSLLILALIALAPAFSQETASTPKKKKFNITDRAGDHLMLQLGSTSWIGAPDSVKSHMKGFNRSANIYAMINKPFKGDPRFSFAFGLGVGVNNVYFKEMEVDIASSSAILPFRTTQGTNHFKKYKLSTAYLEAPLEFRFTANPEMPSKTIKIALGAKLGTMLNAQTKNKNLLTSNGSALNGFTQKETSKAYFNTTRLSGTIRAGYGNFSLYSAYTFTNLFKDGVAKSVNPIQFGITLSGL